MKVLKDEILELPNGLSQSNLYKLLKLFDTKLIEKYNQEFTPSEEFSAVREAVKYFYTNPEKTDSGDLDEEANEIDLNFLSMMILAGKSTREFMRTLTVEFDGEPLFNLSGSLDTAIEIKEDSPYDITVNLSLLESEDSTDAINKLKNMISHLLYFHDMLLKISQFIQGLTVEVEDSTLFKAQDINAIYYELHN